MSKFSPKTRAVAGVAILIGLAAMYYLWVGFLAPLPTRQGAGETTATIQAPADGSLAIRVDGFGFDSYEPIIIKGAGFDPDAATAVVFTTRTKEKLTVPATRVTTTEVAVPMPPLEYNETKGAFSADQASLMVVQTKRDGDTLKVRSSNRSQDFLVSAPIMPSAVLRAEGGKLPTGSIARLVVAVAVEKLKSAAGKVPEGNPEVAAALAKAQKGMEELLAGIEKIRKNPKATVKLATTDGATVSMGADDVAKIDLLYGGYLGQLEKRQSEAAGEGETGLVASALAATASDCVEAVMDRPDTDSGLVSVVEMLCGVTGSLPATGGEDWVNEPYLLQLIATLSWGQYTDSWNIPLKVAAAAELSMLFDMAIDGKLPDSDLYKSLAVALGGEVGDKVLEKLFGKRIPFLANLQSAIEAWDIGCKAFSWTKCLSSREIAVGTGDIVMDIGDRINDTLLPYVDAILPPDYSKSTDLGPNGINNDGYDEWIGPDVTPEPYLPEAVTVPSKPSPKPIVPHKVTPQPAPVPAPTPTPKPVPKPDPACRQIKEATLKDCQADCPAEQTMEEYSACTSGCSAVHDLIEKSNCVNNCIGAWSKSKTVRSSCMSGCMKAYNDTVCP